MAESKTTENTLNVIIAEGKAMTDFPLSVTEQRRKAVNLFLHDDVVPEGYHAQRLNMLPFDVTPHCKHPPKHRHCTGCEGDYWNYIKLYLEIGKVLVRRQDDFFTNPDAFNKVMDYSLAKNFDLKIGMNVSHFIGATVKVLNLLYEQKILLVAPVWTILNEDITGL